MYGRLGTLIRHRWVLLVAAVLLTIGTILLLTVSIGTIRNRSLFDRSVRRIEQLERQGSYGTEYEQELIEAARFARRTQDWDKLVRLSWCIPGPERWRTVHEIATIAMSSVPDHAVPRIAGAYAALRLGNNEAALQAIQPIQPAGEIVQFIYILASLDLERTANGAADPGEQSDIVNVVFTALREPSAESLKQAWQATEISAFGLNSALYAAAAGRREETRTLVGLLRQEGVGNRANLYLAAWLGDQNWLFNQLRNLPPVEAVAPDALLLQADAHERQAQPVEARRIYRELQETSPELGSLPFINDAVLTARMGDGDYISILERGVRVHRDDPDLQFVLAAKLARRGRLEDARSQLALVQSRGSTPHATWLLNRIVRARMDALGSAPPERLESDLWTYINNNADAHQVASYLARILQLRGNTAGMAELRRRYGSDIGPWSATLHLLDSATRNQFGQAEAVLPYMATGSTGQTGSRDFAARAGYYNRALFALRHLPIHEAAQHIAAYRIWWERDAVLPPGAHAQAGSDLHLLEAELARFRGDRTRARARVEQAIALTPDRESLYSYRTLLASHD